MEETVLTQYLSFRDRSFELIVLNLGMFSAPLPELIPDGASRTLEGTITVVKHDDITCCT